MLKNILSILIPTFVVILASCGGASTPDACFHITKKLGYDKNSKKAKVEEISTARVGDTVYFVACENGDQFYSVWPGDLGFDISKVADGVRSTVAGIGLIKSDTLAFASHKYNREGSYEIVFKSNNISANLEELKSSKSTKKITIAGTNPGVNLR